MKKKNVEVLPNGNPLEYDANENNIIQLIMAMSNKETKILENDPIMIQMKKSIILLCATIVGK